MPAASPDRLTLAAFAATVMIGGMNFVAVRESNEGLPPLWGAALRFGAASFLLLFLALATRVPPPRGRALRGSAIYGALNFAAGYAFAYWALVDLPAGVASVVVALVPLLTLLLAVVHGQEAFRWRGAAGAAIAVAGIAVIFREALSGAVEVRSLLLMFGAAVCFAETGVVVKHFPRSHPTALNAVGMAVGAVLLGVVSLATAEPVGPPRAGATWLAVGYLVVVGSIGLFLLYVWVLGRWTASATSYGFVLTPLVAVPAGAWLGGEAVEPAFLAGGVLVLLGVWVGALSGARRSPAPAAAPSPAPAEAPGVRR